ncbi:hypothetical protein BC829DRAFT_394235 [Chytridium lagenaria]|nr:hypothetical protein BC829DRAFT_394235 [Chytridium lagenaria]
MKNETMTLEDCVDDDEQRYRHYQYLGQESIMGAQNMNERSNSNMLTVDECNGLGRYNLTPDSKLTSIPDLVDRQCENSTASGWIYEYLPSTTVSSKERLFRLKAGNGQCLHQIFRRGLIDDPTRGFQNIKFFQCLSTGLDAGSCNRLVTTYFSGGKLINSRLSQRLCLAWDSLYKPCDDSSDEQGWEVETFIPPPPYTRHRDLSSVIRNVESYYCLDVKGSVDPNEIRTLKSTDDCSFGTARLGEDHLTWRTISSGPKTVSLLAPHPSNLLTKTQCSIHKIPLFPVKIRHKPMSPTTIVTQYQLQPCSDVDIQKFRLDVTRSFILTSKTPSTWPFSYGKVSDDFGRMGIVPQARPYRLCTLKGNSDEIVCLSSTLKLSATVNATFSWVVETL